MRDSDGVPARYAGACFFFIVPFIWRLIMKEGDVVQLKTGNGPVMVVEGPLPIVGASSVICVYSVGDLFYRLEFTEVCLKLYEPRTN